MQSLTRKALIAFCGLLVLDLFVRFNTSKETLGPKGMEHLSYDPVQVSTLAIASGGVRITLEKSSRGWERVGIPRKARNVSDLLTPAQTQEVEAFLQRICSLVRESIEGIPDNKDTIYGLDPDHSVWIRIQWKGNENNKRSFTVRFGSVLPLNVMYVYASFDDKPGLFKVLKTYKESALNLLHSLSRL
ncbi:MAG: hypothetical protein N2442_06565 [Spirochaetes bacterium]|nr:hypothetical protein [Spirochaetota bacterium]